MEKKGKHRRLSIAELKNFKNLENLSDEEAESAISTLEKLSVLFYELYQKKKASEIGESKVKNKTNGKERDAA
jgi:hypothetical protein